MVAVSCVEGDVLVGPLPVNNVDSCFLVRKIKDVVTRMDKRMNVAKIVATSANSLRRFA